MLRTTFTITTLYLIVYCLLMTFVSSAPITTTLQNRGLGVHRLIKDVQDRLFSGTGTFYEVGSGSCGENDTDSEMVVAVNSEQMDNGANPNTNPRCEKMVYIKGDQGTTNARIVDTCPSCASGALDMSPTVYKKVCGSLSTGVCSISWSFVQ